MRSIESKLLGFDQPAVLLECPYRILNDIFKFALMGFHPAHIVVVIVGQPACYCHDEHLQTYQSILKQILFTSKLLMIVLSWKLEACSSKQERNCYSKIPIIILCQKVKNKVILMVRNLSRGEQGARGCLRAWQNKTRQQREQDAEIAIVQLRKLETQAKELESPLCNISGYRIQRIKVVRILTMRN